MKLSQGWTLVELVLTISLMGLMGLFVFRLVLDKPLFLDFQFRHELAQSVYRAQLIHLYTNQKVSIITHEDKLVFEVEGHQSEPHGQWQVELPPTVKVQSIDFPLIWGKDERLIDIQTQNHIVQILPKTGLIREQSKD